MQTITIDANTEEDAKNLCPFHPDAIREVDSGKDNTRAWMCFESTQDAELWDKQL